MTKLVVFDIDGTILDSFAVFERAVAQYSRDNNLPMPCMDTIKLGYGEPHAHDFKWGVDRDTQLRHLYGTFKLADIWATSGDMAHMPPLYDGTLDLLTALKDGGHQLAIVTSKPSGPLAHMLDHYRLNNYFSAIRTSCDIRARGEAEKPAPDQLASVMRELKRGADESVMIGDTVMDIKMGRAAGACAIGVTWGAHPREHLEAAGAHRIVDTRVTDIIHALE